jgi:AraC-like DNA-binding protein
MSALDIFREAGTEFHTTDPVEAFRHLSEALSRHKTPLPRDVSAINVFYRHIEIPGLSIYRLRYGAPIKLELSPPDNHYILQLTLRGSTAACFEGGVELVSNPGDFIVVNPGKAFTKIWEAEADQLMIRISAAAVERVVGVDEGYQACRHVRFEPQTVSLEKTPTLFGYIRMLCEDLDTGGCMLATPHAAKSVVTSIASLMVHSLPNNRNDRSRRLQSPAVPYYVQRAVNYIQAHYEQDLTLDRIAAASSVSVRALERGFKKFRSQTPMEYLRSVRLDAARQKLLQTHVTSRTVTAIAEACGFRHLGRFSRAYATRFGELPSETAG